MAGTTDTGGKRRAPIAAINVTPFVDVTLVLLVIMMVSATHIVSQTMKVNLPKTSTSDGGAESLAAVSIDGEHRVFLNKQEVTLDELKGAFGRLKVDDPEATVVISADTKAEHGKVIEVMDLARGEGLSNFAVNVERRQE